MQVVFFSEALQARAPSVLSCLYDEATKDWITIVDVVDAIKRRETVAILPATDSELKRAEAIAALFDIGFMLGEKVADLLDQEPPEVVTQRLTSIRDAMESVNTGPVELIDRKP